MSISETNLNLINILEKDLKGQLFHLARKGLDYQLATLTWLRQLRQFLIALSVAIVGIIFPRLIDQNLVSLTGEFFLTSLILFSILIIWGAVNLILTATQEREQMRLVNTHQTNKLLGAIKELQQIKTILDNNVAGQRFEELKRKYTPTTRIKNTGFSYFLTKYEDAIILSLFIIGLGLLLCGLFISLWHSFYVF